MFAGDYIINGGKMWITNGLQADWMCVLANTSDGAIHENKSLFILPLTTPGITIAKDIRKIGMHSSDTAQFFFEDVRIPQKYLIGEEGKGFVYQMMQFVDERVFGAASGKSRKSKERPESVKFTVKVHSQERYFRSPF
jgi:citronellyl-CoA dehydrogenase